MDIERLTKTQIVLLTLLVSFMTSIATGIVTVTLLDQAPPAITQTINRVVERTIERVVPDKTENQSASVITKEVTVVVKENDLITESIATNSKHLVRIFRKADPALLESKDTFVAIGTIISKGGLIVTDGKSILDTFGYSLITANGEAFDVSLKRRDSDNYLAFLQIKAKETPKAPEWNAAVFGDLSVLKLGTTVIALSGKERTNVAIGIIASLDVETVSISPKDEKEKPTEKDVLVRIKTDIAKLDISLGSPLIDIFGEVIGIYTTESGQEGHASYIPISLVESELSLLAEASATSTNN